MPLPVLTLLLLLLLLQCPAAAHPCFDDACLLGHVKHAARRVDALTKHDVKLSNLKRRRHLQQQK
jgi:hypothetical protein